VYKEIPLNAEQENLIVGSSDGGIPVHGTLVELKSVGAGTLRFEEPELLRSHTHKTISGKSLIDYDGLWRGINRPFASHQRQGQIYLWLCRYAGLDFDRVTFVYESKFTQGAKEFVVRRRESIIESLVDSAYEIKAALDGRGSVPRCPTGGCKRCEQKGNGNGSEIPPGRPGIDRGTDRQQTRRKGPGVRIQADRGVSRAA
jgi:hypothetical protein